jgi:hypothetical protein
MGGGGEIESIEKESVGCRWRRFFLRVKTVGESPTSHILRQNVQECTKFTEFYTS